MSSLEEEFEYYRETQILLEALQQGINQASPRDEAEIVSEWITALEVAGLGLLVKGDIYNFFKQVTGQTAEQFGQSCKVMLQTADMKRVADAFAYAYEKIKDSGADVNQVAPKLLYPILEEIGKGYQDETMQVMLQRLFALCIAGQGIRYEYLTVVQSLDPIDARVLNFLYSQKEAKLAEILDYAKISNSEIELNVSLNKISEDLKLCSVVSNHNSNAVKGNPHDSSDVFGIGGYIKYCMINTGEERRKDKPLIVTVAFSPLGVGFMECVTKDLEPVSTPENKD